MIWNKRSDHQRQVAYRAGQRFLIVVFECHVCGCGRQSASLSGCEWFTQGRCRCIQAVGIQLTVVSITVFTIHNLVIRVAIDFRVLLIALDVNIWWRKRLAGTLSGWNRNEMSMRNKKA